MNAPSGPLFDGPPGAHGVPWLHVLPLLVAVPAVVLLLWGLVRGRLSPTAGVFAVSLPIATYGLCSLLMMEDSKNVAFCGSCHVMTPVVASLRGDDGSLASLHYARGLLPQADACFICHSGYGIWGTLDAKISGLMHMVRTATGDYTLPITLNGVFDIDSCLGCHAAAQRFRAVEMHQDPDVQKALVAREMSCTGVCHPAAHPDSALTGGQAIAQAGGITTAEEETR